MKLVNLEDELTFTSEIVSLGKLYPVINGERLIAPLRIVHQSDQSHHAVARTANADFHVEIAQESETVYSLRYNLEGLASDFVLDSFGICFAELRNLRAFMRSGYNSWDGSYYVEPECAPGAQTQGYAFTQLLPRTGDGSIVIGFDHHERFQQTFTLDSRSTPPSLTIETLWDRKVHDGSARSENLMLLDRPGNDHEAALRVWAQNVAEVMLPRLSAPPISGWCSWYNLYAMITEENILDHLQAAQTVVQREQLPFWVFQIDDGFTPEMGDWLEVKPQFPRGIKLLLDDIRAGGFTPGLWIAPFLVGNRSHLYHDHPDWVVQDRQTNQPLIHMHFYGEFRWHKRSEEYYVLDTTHPDAFEYLRQVFRIWRNEWGCEYFKTDFMNGGSAYGPDRAVWHQPGLSRIEIWRRTAEMIREEIGDATWLGCGCPLWASVGLVDGVRIGRDVGVQWSGDSLSAQSLLRDLSTRNFANGILWQADPDCVLLREHFHDLTDTEVRSLAIYGGMAGGVFTTSDKLDEVSPERLHLVKFLLSNVAQEQSSRVITRFPLLGKGAFAYSSHEDTRRDWNSVDPVIVQVRADALPNGHATVFIFNTGDTMIERTYSLRDLGLPSPANIEYPVASTPALEQVSQVSVTLAPHESSLLLLT